MLSKERIKDVLDEIRGEFLFPPASLDFHEKRAAPCIGQMKIMVWPGQFVDDEHCRCVLRHELGHPHYAPRTIKEHKKHIKNIVRVIGFNIDSEKGRVGTIPLVQNLANVVYDMIIEWCLIEYHGNDFNHAWNCDVEALRKDFDSMSKNPLWVALAGYYTVLTDYNGFGLEEKDMEIGRKALKIIESPVSMDEKVTDVAVLFRDLAQKLSKQIEKSMEELLKEFVEVVMEFMERTGKSFGGATATMETMRGGKKGEKEACLDAMDAPCETPKEEEREEAIVRGIAIGSGIKIADTDILRVRARKRLSFRIKPQTGRQGLAMNSGWETWTTDKDIASLDVEETLQSHGVVIPEVTAMGHLKNSGRVLTGAGFSRIWLCIDTSGSMHIDRTLLAIFSLVETARFFGAECGLVMFADTHVVFNPTRNYNKIEEDACSNYHKAGGGNSVPGCDVLVPMAKKGDLVVFISDFGFSPKDIMEAGDILKEKLPFVGAQVATIVMFTESYISTIPGLPYVFCEDIGELAGRTIDAVTARFAA